jgi:hypothetical protein
MKIFRKNLSKKLVYLQDVLSREEQAKFLEILKRDYPKVFDAWLKNTETMEKEKA